MKTIYATLLLIFIALNGKSQTSPPTTSDNMKAAAGASAERAFQNALNRVVAWVDTMPQHYRNQQAKKRTDELNKTRCYDTLECKLDSTAQILVIDARKHGVKCIAVWYFNDTVTKLGYRMAEKLSIALSNADDSLEIVDRQHIDAVMKEHQLAADGLIDPETAKILGHFLHADAIITGSIRVWKNVININIKMIDIETGVMLSGKTVQIPMTKEYDIKPAVASDETTASGQAGSSYSLPFGFYFIPGSPEGCEANQTGQLVVKNMTGKEINIDVAGPGYRRYVFVRATEGTTFFQLPVGLYRYTIKEAGSNALICEDEFVIRACANLGFSPR